MRVTVPNKIAFCYLRNQFWLMVHEHSISDPVWLAFAHAAECTG